MAAPGSTRASLWVIDAAAYGLAASVDSAFAFAAAHASWRKIWPRRSDQST